MARPLSLRTLALGGLAVAAAAGALKNRKKVAGAIGGGSSTPEPYPAATDAPVGQQAAEPGPSAAPAVSNFDAAGPPSNTATAVPAPEPQVHEPAGGIDEAAEEAAAAAEAANIGGGVSEYPGLELGETADEELRPLMEAGEGEAEGQELAEFELADNAEPAAGDPLEGGRQIEDVIEAQEDPFSGEQPFDDQSSHGNPRAEAEQSAVGTADPLQDPPPGSDPRAPGARGETTEGAAPTPPNPGATTSDASAAQLSADAPSGDTAGDVPPPPPAPGARVTDVPAPPDGGGTPEPGTGDTLAAGTIGEGAPTTGGSLSGAVPPPPEPPAEPIAAPETTAAEKSANVWRIEDAPPGDAGSGATPLAAPDEQPTVEQPKVEEAPDEDDGSEWQTWSGRAVDS